MSQHFNKAIKQFGQVASKLQIVPKGVVKNCALIHYDNLLFRGQVGVCTERLARKLAGVEYPHRKASLAMLNFELSGGLDQESIREIASFTNKEAEEFVDKWMRWKSPTETTRLLPPHEYGQSLQLLPRTSE